MPSIWLPSSITTSETSTTLENNLLIQGPAVLTEENEVSAHKT